MKFHIDIHGVIDAPEEVSERVAEDLADIVNTIAKCGKMPQMSVGIKEADDE